MVAIQAVVIALGLYAVTFPWWLKPDPKAGAWRFTPVSAAPADESGQLVRYGAELISRTSAYLGPDAVDPQMRIAGNRLACGNCHLDAGTKQDAIGYVGIMHRFPQFNARAGRVITIEDRINGCFERSLAGRRLNNDSQEIRAMVA